MKRRNVKENPKRIGKESKIKFSFFIPFISLSLFHLFDYSRVNLSLFYDPWYTLILIHSRTIKRITIERDSIRESVEIIRYRKLNGLTHESRVITKKKFQSDCCPNSFWALSRDTLKKKTQRKKKNVVSGLKVQAHFCVWYSFEDSQNNF